MFRKNNRLRIAKHWLTSVFLVACCLVSAQEIDLPFTDATYNNSIRTIVLRPADDSLAAPIIGLDRIENQLRLTFDLLGDEAVYLNYTFVHCTSDWQPSGLQSVEYRSGFDSENIENYRFSVNTLVDYTHYELTFPTATMVPLLSGNYLLVVFSDDLSAENIYFTRRFCIAESVAIINASVPRYPFDLGLGNTIQQIDLAVTMPDIFNSNIQRDLTATIQQNRRWDNAAIGIKPTFVYPNSISFANNVETVFQSGNLFRYFNTSSIHYQNENIKSIRQTRYNYAVTLYPNQKRTGKPFIDYPTLNGKKFISVDLNRDSGIEADYCEVEFFLDYYPPLTHEDVYVIGELTDWLLTDDNRMTYDYEQRGYKTTLLLKQGYYNYAYAAVGKGAHTADMGQLEGNYWETNNEYTIFVYLHDVIKNYDRLIGVKTIMAH